MRALIATIEAHRAAPGFAVYSAAKAAVEQFARTLAVELAPDGIRVNNIAPDFVPPPTSTASPRVTTP
ncbi:SDR family oxidoreductase [Nocardia brevicatena]|uniref:SDR family oxidoreductase n=1 Tax=Nocardia brevicatena TaxID=37327 RepID=UPI00030C51D8|nr:SDR family oxidoreductase [Nocardia brevicatena]